MISRALLQVDSLPRSAHCPPKFQRGCYMRLCTRMIARKLMIAGTVFVGILDVSSGAVAQTQQPKAPARSRSSSGGGRTALAAAAKLDCELLADQARTRVPRRPISLSQTDETAGALGSGASACRHQEAGPIAAAPSGRLSAGRGFPPDWQGGSQDTSRSWVVTAPGASRSTMSLMESSIPLQKARILRSQLRPCRRSHSALRCRHLASPQPTRRSSNFRATLQEYFS